MKTKLCINPEWEYSKLENNEFIFSSFYKKTAKIENPPLYLDDLLSLCDGTLTQEDIKNIIEINYPSKKSNIEEVILDFISCGILEETSINLDEFLNIEEKERYVTFINSFSKYNLLPNQRFEIYKKLINSKICIIGLGGTGSLISMMLASCGIKNITLIDGDEIESSNLVRQIFYNQEDIGNRKVKTLKKKLEKFNPFINVEIIDTYINCEEDLLKNISLDTDFIFLEADAPRILLNRWVNNFCVNYKIPYISSFSNQVGPIYIPKKSSCFSCLENNLNNKYENYSKTIEVFKKLRTRKYPSSILGIPQNCHFQVQDAIGYLTGLYEPLTLNKILKFTNNIDKLIEIESIPINLECKTCQK